MIYPSADTVEPKITSRYALVVLAAKRAKQIKEGAPILIDTLSTNPLTIAMEEIAAGKVGAMELPGTGVQPHPASTEATTETTAPALAGDTAGAVSEDETAAESDSEL